MLAPDRGKTATGRPWTCVRDDRPNASADAPAVWFAYAPDRKGEHPSQHLKSFEDILQAAMPMPASARWLRQFCEQHLSIATRFCNPPRAGS